MPHSCMESTSLCNSCCLLLRAVRMIHYVSITRLDYAAENKVLVSSLLRRLGP